MRNMLVGKSQDNLENFENEGKGGGGLSYLILLRTDNSYLAFTHCRKYCYLTVDPGTPAP
jgi:hypothetical protein